MCRLLGNWYDTRCDTCVRAISGKKSGGANLLLVLIWDSNLHCATVRAEGGSLVTKPMLFSEKYLMVVVPCSLVVGVLYLSVLWVP